MPRRCDKCHERDADRDGKCYPCHKVDNDGISVRKQCDKCNERDAQRDGKCYECFLTGK